MASTKQDEIWNGLPASGIDPSIWNPTASVIRNVDLELVFYGREQCSPQKHWGPGLKNHYKVHYVHNGKGMIRVGEKVHHLCKGQCFIFYPDVAVYYEADADDPWDYSWVAFEGTNAEYYLKRANIDRENIVVDHCDQPTIEDAFARLMQVDMTDGTKDMKFISLLYLILSAILVSPDESAMLRNMRYPSVYIKTALKYIQEKYASQITVSEIAHYLSLDRKYFSRIFKDHLKISPNTYIANYRLMKAAELLAATSLGIGEISAMVGYENPFSFSRAFKKFNGSSPSSYREQKAADAAKEKQV